MTPEDYADLRPEPLDPEACVYRGQVYRRHETWGDHPVCVRCGRDTDTEEISMQNNGDFGQHGPNCPCARPGCGTGAMPTHEPDCQCAICRPA